MQKFTLVLLLLCSFVFAHAQSTTYATETFRDTRIISTQSVETSVQGQAKFIISHRFGDLYDTNAFSILYNFFGFNGGANMRIGLDYGITNWLEVGAGRNNLDKTYDGFVKARILRQSSGDRNMPVSMTWYSGMSVITDTNSVAVDPYFANGIGFCNQLIIARKFNEGFSLQIMPTHVHLNLVEFDSNPNDIFSIGAATKVRVAKQIDLTAEYIYTFPGQLLPKEDYANCVAIGADFATKGHVFQLQFTNSPFLIPEHFIAKPQGEVVEKVNGKNELNLRLGFNITRTFKVTGRQY